MTYSTQTYLRIGLLFFLLAHSLALDLSISPHRQGFFQSQEGQFLAIYVQTTADEGGQHFSTSRRGTLGFRFGYPAYRQSRQTPINLVKSTHLPTRQEII
ncbi:unnamed protein product [Protopolystoma xenopodis]|uniref:Uncharacterized protein n=1 Tax=Protopolystoma xenopodis TaxID=117903 RepID=A0A448X198_9PLAT|nr:unnamed protein product [Protopolystoma xenopodis]